MKVLFRYIMTLFAVAGLWLASSEQVRADFEEKPIAYVVIDHSGAVDGAVYGDFRSVVKLAYYFPHYRLIEGGKAQEVVADMITTKAKLNKENLAWAAEQAQVEGLVVARIYEMAQYRVPRMSFRDMEELERTVAYADLMVYRKTGDKFLAKKLRENEIREMGVADKPDYTIKWALSRLVNTMEGREII